MSARSCARRATRACAASTSPTRASSSSSTELDALSPEAEALGAVNTVVLDDGRRVGHNTDASGFREAFERRLPGARTDHVVLLGAGGAGAAVGQAILALGAQQLTILDVERDRADDLADLARSDGAGHDRPRRRCSARPTA